MYGTYPLSCCNGLRTSGRSRYVRRSYSVGEVAAGITMMVDAGFFLLIANVVLSKQGEILQRAPKKQPDGTNKKHRRQGPRRGPGDGEWRRKVEQKAGGTEGTAVPVGPAMSCRRILQCAHQRGNGNRPETASEQASSIGRRRQQRTTGNGDSGERAR